LSTAVADLIILHAGYSAALLFLAAAAGVGLIGYGALMPETLRADATMLTSTASAGRERLAHARRE